MQHPKNDENSNIDNESIRITITEEGPYLIYGHPPLAMQHIMPDDNNESWYFQEGLSFSTAAEPTALCRCGSSKRAPYCDGSHAGTDWDPELTASAEIHENDVETIEGATIDLLDNAEFCVFARFCHPNGDAWELTEHSDTPEARRLAIREASMCPSGRLTARDRQTQQSFEFYFEPSLGLIEDAAIGSSGGLWVRGGIPIQRATGETYAIRNRVVLCRCGQSANKPYCDGTHASFKWLDDLTSTPEGETLPEKVY